MTTVTMNSSSFANPLEIVQYISVFSYMNTLSDFLYVENYLQEDGRNKRIPIVNALYEYLHDYDYNQVTKKKLIRKLLEGSDLYGEHESEILNVHFVNTMFEHIITSLVFDKYRSIHGFLAEIICSLDNATIYSFNERVLEVLETKTFENEFGEDSTLSRFSVARIFVDLIMPLFPQPKNDMRLLSVDYIYAQAGSLFLRSSKRKSAYYSETNFFGMSVTGMNIFAEIISYMSSNIDIFEADIPSENPTDIITFQKFISIPDSSLEEYIGMGIAIEEMVISKKLDKLVLSSFAFPAFVYSAVSKKSNIDVLDIEYIMENSTYMSKAYQLLFSYLETSFKDIEKVHDEDYRYQFHLALSNFKNRMELKKLPMSKICSLLAEYETLEAEREYQVQGKFECTSETVNKLLNDIDVLFEKQINYIKNKYFLYEKEMIREAFGPDFIESVNAAKVFIMKASLFRFDCDLRNFQCLPTQLIKPSDDLLEFYDLDNHNSSYYALIREDENVTFIKEADNPMLFRKKLQIENVTFDRNWNYPYKHLIQNFDHFLNNLAGERADKFEAHLDQISTPRTKDNWWKEFGLSLIPFYSCITGGVKGHIVDALTACPMDIISVNPILKGVGLATKVTRAATRNLLSKVGTTIESMSLKALIQSIVKTGSYAYATKNIRLETLVSKDIFEDFGNLNHRLVDSGLELLSSLGKSGIESLREMYLNMKSSVKFPFHSLKIMIDVAENMLTSDSKIIGEKFGRNTYVRTLFGDEHSGYGYKYLLFRDDQVAQLRSVLLKDGKIVESPVILDKVTEKNVQLYKISDPETGMVKKGPYLYANRDGYLVEYTERKSYKYSLASFDDASCDSRFKRTPSKKLLCIRTQNLKKKLQRESEAIAIAHNKFPEEQIRNELRKYDFVDVGKTEREFVEEWLVNGEKPEWSQMYRIEEPEYFFKLKYTVRLDLMDIIEEEAERRIDSLYTPSQQKMIQAGRTAGEIAQEYMESKAYNAIVFEDYYALCNYMAFGYSRMTGNTNEARRMKHAIYTLAMRQADDPIQEFVTTLYRGEMHSREALSKMFSGEREFVLNKFCSASQSESIASAFAGFSNRKRGGLLLKMKFGKNKRYLRANVNKIHETYEKETILLPGSKFNIEKVSEQTNFGGRIYVELTFLYNEPTKVDWQRNTMHEINELKRSDTVFYHQ